MANQPAKGRKTPTPPTQSQEAGKKPAGLDVAVSDVIPPEVHPRAAQTPAKAPQAPDVASKPAASEKPPTPTYTEPQKPEPTPPARRGGFVPLVLGGLVAGVIGFGVATLTTAPADSPLSDRLAGQSAEIAALQEKIAQMPSLVADDLAALQAAQEAVSADISRLDAAVAALQTRLDDLPSIAIGDAATLPAPDMSAYQAELDALRAQMQDELSTMTQTAQSELAAARAQAATIEQSAQDSVRRSAGRAALARVQTALDSGAPLGALLDDLADATGDAIPDDLAAARDGVPTLASLQDTFPDAARTALATARSAGVAGEDTSGFAAFLRNQFDVRSVAPREGTTVDAILSRAEAAIKSGRLSDALAELASLPDVARADLSDWLKRAELRASALTAADMLATTFNDK
ncbi:hypothetical protein [Yoonia sp.]|uniref:COG4223 family protein n=1 Tax=Yoonia sp. TaxID=2212373 RepID=UPI0019E4C1E2|nr:hypothetical protein [Yoonia sp.]MBE0413896.1 hypothetical protein [Yoonia sp.]